MSLRKLVVPLIVIMLAVSPAAADSGSVQDGDDTPGRLDIALLRHDHMDKALWHSVTMHERWRSRALRGSGSYLYIWFSTDNEDAYAERRIWIDFRDGRLIAGVEHYDEFSDGAGVSPIRRLRVTRPNRKTVKVLFRPGDLGRDVTSYKWSAFSSFRSPDSDACGRCFDHAPEGGERGLVTHRL